MYRIYQWKNSHLNDSDYVHFVDDDQWKNCWNVLGFYHTLALEKHEVIDVPSEQEIDPNDCNTFQVEGLSVTRYVTFSPSDE